MLVVGLNHTWSGPKVDCFSTSLLLLVSHPVLCSTDVILTLGLASALTVANNDMINAAATREQQY